MADKEHSLEITYGEGEDSTFDFSTMPHSTLVAMLRRGVSHYFGSEAASKILTKIEKAICEGASPEDTKARTEAFAALSASDRRESITAFRKANPEAIAAWAREVRAEQVKAMVEGTVGVSVRGPTVDPLAAVERRLAKAEVVNTLKANKVAIPKKSDGTIAFPNGDSFTLGELVDRRLGHADHGPRIRKEAKAVIAAQERAAKKAAEQGLDTL